MDLETENRIASVLLREAAELRRQAEKDGARAYIEKPNAQEQENERLKRKSREESSSSSSSSQMKQSSSFSKRSLDKRCSSINEERKITHQSSLDKRLYLDDDDEGLGDDEIESFLQSRNKRGRGSVGPRMDETVPYLPTEKVDQLQSSDTRERKRVSQRRMGSVGEVSGGGFKCGSDDLRGCGGRRGEEQNDCVMGGKKLLQQEDLLALRPSSCSACLLQ